MAHEMSAHIRSTIRDLLAGTDDPMLRAAVIYEAYHAAIDNYKTGHGEGGGLDGMSGPERHSLGKVGRLSIDHYDEWGRIPKERLRREDLAGW